MNEPNGNAIRPRIVFRNFIIVFGLTAIGGFIIGLATGISGVEGMPIAAIAVSNIMLAILGFFICGCMTPKRRWTYLLFTAIAVWLASIVNVLIAGDLGVSLVSWMLGLPTTLIFMLVGGGISTLFVKSQD
ncbi:MAG: hypothetical protein AAFX40_03995 [Cyanobacteria bacterium J06639_1]